MSFMRTQERGFSDASETKGQKGRYSYTATTVREVDGKLVETRQRISESNTKPIWTEGPDADGPQKETPLFQLRHSVLPVRRLHGIAPAMSQAHVAAGGTGPPSQNKKHLMILETYTTTTEGDDKSPELPKFLKINKEITGDFEYKMYNMASKQALRPCTASMWTTISERCSPFLQAVSATWPSVFQCRRFGGSKWQNDLNFEVSQLAYGCPWSWTSVDSTRVVVLEVYHVNFTFQDFCLLHSAFCTLFPVFVCIKTRSAVWGPDEL